LETKLTLLTSGKLVEANTGKEHLTSGAYLAIASGDPAKPPLAKITAPASTTICALMMILLQEKNLWV
jgi:hypothetical protein